MITVTEEARELFQEIDNPDGTVLRLDPVTTEGVTDETQVRLGIGEPKTMIRWCSTKGKTCCASLVPSARPSTGAPSTWWRRSKDRPWVSSHPTKDYH